VTPTLRIRPAAIDDAALLRATIRELAEYEHELGQVTITEDDLRRDGFSDNPGFRALIAEWDQEPAGYALFFGYYSTWVGRGLYLEDLFVREQFRGRGIGTALLAQVARIAVDEDCRGMHWEVLNWNTKAIAMYREIGSTFPDQWRRVLLSGDALEKLAKKAR
jgi:GNAT superfamily N-acetyltransferase